MKVKGFSSKKTFAELVWIIFLLSIEAWLIIQQFKWNPDPHHDGYMLTGALAINEGLRPNVDFFAQYGPLISIVQGLGLKIFGQTLFGLKLFSALICMITGTILFFRIKQAFGLWVSSAASLCWALTGPMGLPWSSLVTTCLTVISLSMMFKYENEKFNLRPTNLIYSIQLLVIGSFARIHLGVIVFLIILLIVLKRANFTKHYLRKIILATATTLVIIIGILMYFGIFRSYLEQSIFWAFGRYGTISFSLAYFSGLFWWFFVPIVFVLLTLFVKWSSHFTNNWFCKYIYLPTDSDK